MITFICSKTALNINKKEKFNPMKLKSKRGNIPMSTINIDK